MLYQFLEKNRASILMLAGEKTLSLAGNLITSEELSLALPLFYDHLLGYLKDSSVASEQKIVLGAADHGKELLRLNYSLSHVVHSYGAMCQAITEFAQKQHAPISAQEFNGLNLCLDIAIAAAVSEFQFRSAEATEEREIQHLGILVHELRNALSSATVAHEMIKQGLVGTSGSTSRILEENLARMRNLIDRSLSEVRMRSDPQIHIESFSLGTLIDQLLITAQSDARDKKQVLKVDLVSEINMNTDRQLMISAIANLIQNAIKYTKVGGKILIHTAQSGANVVIEVEDECGGLDTAAINNLFKPFVSGGFDRSGLGLGLTIVQRAVFLLQGKVSVRNNPGRGCAFRLEIPLSVNPVSSTRAVSGEKSVQPKQNPK